MEGENPVAWVRIDALGYLQIPAALTKAAGIAGDEPVCVRASEDGEDGIEVLSRRAALKRAHAIARQFVPEGVSLVDDLIAERRREAGREESA
jgi:bifunctional DNA-binding transcriptional regulator/antitoxin component of YhaV-PrlF toxin-antitoxin module